MIATTSDAGQLGSGFEVFDRYAGLSLPRHVSYPMPNWWHDMDEANALRMHAASAEHRSEQDLSLYLHLPFCEKLCKFCGCNKVILPKHQEGAAERVDGYLAALAREIRLLAEKTDAGRPLRQIHWGGGSPSYLDVAQIEHIHGAIGAAFDIADDAEIAMEVDPRGVTPDKLAGLRRMGFNRVSMGIQDFDGQVQAHVRRIQPFEMVEQVVACCRELGFDSVNFDLIYGMPYQTLETIRHTLEQTILLAPDRIAYYHYAQIPEKIATQRGMDYTRLPDSRTKLRMFLLAQEVFERAGYEFIGLDHFARPDDPLAKSHKDGTLQRNFQGMTTGGDLRLLAAGVSGITHLPGVGFLQNIKTTEGYVERVGQGALPVERGKSLTRDDRIRQAVLAQLYCQGFVMARSVEETFGIVFGDYFARELASLDVLERDGLVTVDSAGDFRLTSPLGYVLMRNVAAVFDAYLDPEAYFKGDGCYSANA